MFNKVRSSTIDPAVYFDWVGCSDEAFYQSRISVLEDVARGRWRDEAEKKAEAAKKEELKERLAWLEGGLLSGSPEIRAHVLAKQSPQKLGSKIKIFFSKLLTFVS